MAPVITENILRKFALENPKLLGSVKSFFIRHNKFLADGIVKLAKEAIVPLNGESKMVLGVLRRMFASKNYTAHVAALYEIEATKHDQMQTSDIAAQLYMKAAKESTDLEVKVNCYSRAFYCFLSANKPDDALNAAKMLDTHQITQGLATLYLEAGKLSEKNGDISLAKTFYSDAIGGNYYSVIEAEAALKRITPKVYGEHISRSGYDARFANRETD